MMEDAPRPTQQEQIDARHEGTDLKPDGWHTYHICNGKIRELVWEGTCAYCAVCDQWLIARVENGKDLRHGD